MPSISSRRLLVAFGVLLLFAFPLAAQVGAEFQASQGTSFKRWPAAAMDADGDFVVVWTGNGDDGNGYGIGARLFDSAGSPKAAQFLVNTTTGGTQTMPSVAMDDDGDFVVVWSSLNGSEIDVFGQRFDSAGAPQGTEFQVNVTMTGRQHHPDVAMDSEGDFVVVWHGAVPGSEYDIFGRRFAASGEPQGAEFQVNTTTAGRQYRPEIAMDTDGDFAVVWQGYATGDGEVRGRRFDSAGSPQSTEFGVNTWTGHHQVNPQIAMDGDGDFVVSWQSYFQDEAVVGVFAQRFDAGAVPQGTEFAIGTWGTARRDEHSVAMDDGGAFVTTWVSEDRDGSDHGVFGQRFDSDGAAQGSAFQVNSVTTGDQVSSAVAADANGNFVAAWVQYSSATWYGPVSAALSVPETGSITIAQQTTPDDDPQLFDFDVSSIGAPSPSLSDGDVVTFSGLAAGTYPVSQTLPSGWQLDSIVCQADAGTNESVIDSGEVDIVVHSRQTVTCTFNNSATEAPVATPAPQHWARTASPLTLTVHDNVAANWEDALTAAAGDWSASPDVEIDLAMQSPLTAPRNCTATMGRAEVCSALFGRVIGWLAVTRLHISGQHILRANTRLNNSFFAQQQYDTPAWRQFTLCHELGHMLGLVNRDQPSGSCMSAGTPASNTTTDSWDHAVLAATYEHLDRFDSVLALQTGALSRPATIEEQTGIAEEAWGLPLRFDGAGRPDLFATTVIDEQGETVTELTHVTWAPLDESRRDERW